MNLSIAQEKFHNFLQDYITTTKEESHNLFNCFDYKVFGKGIILEKANSVPKNHFLFMSGFVRRYFINENGDQVITDINNGIEFLSTYVHFLNKTVSPINYIETITEVEVLCINYKNFSKMLINYPVMKELETRYLLMLSNRHRQRSVALATQNPQKRYHLFLENFPNIIREVPLTYIASYIGVTPQSLSRIRARLSNSK